MNTKLIILQRLDEICRNADLDDRGDIQWEDGQVIRACSIRAERGDPSGWQTFVQHLRANPDVACGFYRIFEELGWATYSFEQYRLILSLPEELSLSPADMSELQTIILDPEPDSEDEEPAARNKKQGKVMYIEEKPGLAGHARIGRVTFSASRKTI